MADMMKVAVATSDPIESFFGIHDNVASKLSKNTSFHVTSVLATWIHNDSSAFLKSLSQSQRVCILRGAVRNADRLKRETAAAISQAAKDKLKRLEKDAKKTHETEKKLIHDLLCLRREILIKSVEQFDAFRESVSDADNKVVKEMRKQVRMLHKVSCTPHTCTCSHIHPTHSGARTPAQRANDVHLHEKTCAYSFAPSSISCDTFEDGVRNDESSCEECARHGLKSPSRFSRRNFH